MTLLNDFDGYVFKAFWRQQPSAMEILCLPHLLFAEHGLKLRRGKLSRLNICNTLQQRLDADFNQDPRNFPNLTGKTACTDSEAGGPRPCQAQILYASNVDTPPDLMLLALVQLRRVLPLPSGYWCC